MAACASRSFTYEYRMPPARDTEMKQANWIVNGSSNSSTPNTCHRREKEALSTNWRAFSWL